MLKKLLFISLLLTATICYADWTYIWDLENGTSGDTCSQSVADQSGSHGNETFINGVYNTDHAYEGNNSCRIAFTEGGTGGGAGYVEPDHITIVDGESEYWAGMWCYFGTASDNVSGEDWSPASQGATGWWKYLRVAKHDSSYVSKGFNSIYGGTSGNFRGDLENVSIPTGPDTINVYEDEPYTYPNVGVWNYYEMHYVMGITEDTGHIDIWINGDAIISKDVSTCDVDTEYYGGYNLIFTYWNDGCSQDQYAYIDNYYISTVERAYPYSYYEEAEEVDKFKVEGITASNVTFN